MPTVTEQGKRLANDDPEYIADAIIARLDSV
jgi:hypothetical protein